MPTTVTVGDALIDRCWTFHASMARRARKYYLGLGTITQKVADLSDGGNGDTILANAAIVMLLKQKAETNYVAAERFRLTGDERQFLLAADKGEGLLLVRGSRTPVQIVSSRAEYRLATTSPRDLEQLAAERRTAGPNSQPSASASAGGPGGGVSLGEVFAERRKERRGDERRNGDMS